MNFDISSPYSPSHPRSNQNRNMPDDENYLKFGPQEKKGTKNKMRKLSLRK